VKIYLTLCNFRRHLNKTLSRDRHPSRLPRSYSPGHFAFKKPKGGPIKKALAAFIPLTALVVMVGLAVSGWCGKASSSPTPAKSQAAPKKTKSQGKECKGADIKLKYTATKEGGKSYFCRRNGGLGNVPKGTKTSYRYFIKADANGNPIPPSPFYPQYRGKCEITSVLKPGK
jgi:hypothetical protein